MAGPDVGKTVDLSSTNIQMISKVQYLSLVKQESFLRAKYEIEEISPKEIAGLTFSSRSTIVKYLKIHRISLRKEDSFCGSLPYGRRWKAGKIVFDTKEQDAVDKAKKLRARGAIF